MSDLWAAIAIAMVFEGIMPFLSPKNWRASIFRLASLPDKQIRLIGFVVMMLGVVGLNLVRN